MKKILILLALLILPAAFAATVPMYVSGAPGADYTLAGTATVTATNTSITLTNFAVLCTNRTDGDGEVFYVSWRGTAKAYTITSNTPSGDQIASGSTTTNSAFNIMAKLQTDYPFVRVGEFTGASFTLAAPTTESLVVTNSPGYFTVTPSSFYDTTNSTQTVALRANPVTLVTNTVVYVTGLVLDGSGVATNCTYATNSIVISR